MYHIQSLASLQSMYLHCKVHRNPKERRRRERIRQHEVGEYFYFQNLVSLAYKFRLFPATDHRGKGGDGKPVVGPFSAVSHGALSFAWLFLLHGHFKPIPWLWTAITFLTAGLLQAREFQKHRKHSHVVYCQESMCVCDSMPQIVCKIIPCNIPKAIILSNFCISLYISALRPNNCGEIRANPDPSSRSRDLL